MFLEERLQREIFLGDQRQTRLRRPGNQQYKLTCHCLPGYVHHFCFSFRKSFAPFTQFLLLCFHLSFSPSLSCPPLLSLPPFSVQYAAQYEPVTAKCAIDYITDTRISCPFLLRPSFHTWRPHVYSGVIVSDQPKEHMCEETFTMYFSWNTLKNSLKVLCVLCNYTQSVKNIRINLWYTNPIFKWYFTRKVRHKVIYLNSCPHWNKQLKGLEIQ